MLEIDDEVSDILDSDETTSSSLPISIASVELELFQNKKYDGKSVTHGQTDNQTDRQIDGQTDGWTDGWTDGLQKSDPYSR